MSAVMAPRLGPAYPVFKYMVNAISILYWICHMELRHLRYFVAVAHEGHVTRAAEKLHMQQPPLSQQIRALEREIDAALFVRHPRGVALTDAGRSFLVDAEAILAQAEHAKIRARRTARGEVGRIAVGFTTSAPFHPLVARAIREFRAKRPDVSFVLEESSSADMVSGLRDGRLDVAFIRSGLVDPEGVTVHRCCRRTWSRPSRPAIRCPPAAAHAQGSRRRDLHPLPPARRARPLRRHHRGLREAGFSPHVGQEAPRIVSTLNLVAAGLGITIVPASLEPPAAGRCNLSAARAGGRRSRCRSTSPAAATSAPPRRWASSIWCAACRHETPHQDHRPFQPSDRALRRSAEGGRRRAAGRCALDALVAPLPAVRPRAAGEDASPTPASPMSGRARRWAASRRRRRLRRARGAARASRMRSAALIDRSARARGSA